MDDLKIIRRVVAKAGLRHAAEGMSKADIQRRLDAIEEEKDEFKEMSDRLEEFVFMEENATKVMSDLKKMSEKYREDKNLGEASRKALLGFDAFHSRVLSNLSSALEALDEARTARDNEEDELTDELK